MAVLASAFAYSGETQFPGSAAVVPVMGAAVFIWANRVRPLTVAGRILSTKPIVGIGLISYSFYLWHWPIFAFARYSGLEITAERGAMLAIVGGVCGYLSWRFVEQPFRQNKLKQRDWRFLSGAGLIACGFLFISGWFWQSDGIPRRLPESLVDATTWTGEEYATGGELRSSNGELIYRTLGVPRSGSEFDFLLWGDSHAMVLCPMLDSLSRAHGLSGAVLAQHGMPPIGNCVRAGDSMADQKRLNNVATLSSLNTNVRGRVFLVAAWSAYKGDSLTNNTTTKAAGPLIEEGLREIYEQAGENLVVMLDVPRHETAVALTMARNALLGYGGSEVKPCKIETHLERQQDVRLHVASVISDDQVIDPASVLIGSDERQFRAMKDGKPLYRDTNHLTRLGADELQELFEPHFKAMVSSLPGGDAEGEGMPGEDSEESSVMGGEL